MFSKIFLVLMLLCWLAGLARAQQASPFLSQTLTGSASTQIQVLQTTGRHLVMLQACATNTANIYVCLATSNVCTATAAAFELAPGGSFGPITVGMYTGMTQSQLGGSKLFNADLAFMPASGSQCVRALID
jgi:hypothetical protein